MTHRIILLLLTLFSFTATTHADTQIPQTGQTTCYNTAGSIITCTNTGQDGDKLAGVPWPNPRFTDNTDGTVTDNLTGLIWLKNAHCTDTVGGIANEYGSLRWADALTWSNNLTSGKCGLKDGSVAGDWRLPNIVELKSLVDLSRVLPAFPNGHPFSNLGGGWMPWTSSTVATTKSSAWYLNMANGEAMSEIWKGYTLYVWPVRDGHGGAILLPRTGQTGCWDVNANEIACANTGQDGDKLKGAAWPPSPRLVDKANGILIDNLTGLVWLKDANCFGPKNWQQALDASNSLLGNNIICSLNDGTKAGQWRLPNREEMLSLVNYQEVDGGAWLNNQGFVNGQNDFYWTSNTYAKIPRFKWLVHTNGLSFTERYREGYLNYLIPVRNLLPIVYFSPTSKDFGNITTGSTSAGQTFTIFNTGELNLTVSSFALTSGDSGMFTLNAGDGTAGTCGATPTISPTGSCTISVTFTPISAGAKSTTLRTASNDSTTPNKDVALTGTGAAPPTYTIATGYSGSGSIICAPSATVNQNDSTTCTATPDAGNYVASVTVDSLAVPAAVNSATFAQPFINVTASHTMTATFNTKTNQTIKFNPATRTYGDAPLDLSTLATGGGSGNPVTFAIVSGPGTLSGANNDTLSINGAGSIVVRASQAGSVTNNAAADVQQTINVTKATPVITWTTPAGIVYGTALSAVQLNATANVTGTFAYAPPVGNILNANSQTLGLVFTPTDTLNYNNQTAVVNLVVAKANQVITFPAFAAKNVGDPDFDPGAAASTGLPITYTSSNTAIAVINGGVIQIVGGGTAIITASQAGNGNYNPAVNQTQTLTVKGQPAKTQTLYIDTPANGLITNNATQVISGNALNINKNKNNMGAITINNVASSSVIPNNTGDSAFSHIITLSSGVNTITTVGTNFAGTSTVTDTRTVILDQTPPSLTLSALADGAVTTNAVLYVSGTATDAYGITQVTVNGAVVAVDATSGFSYVVNLVPGSNIITITATDTAGNIATVTRTINLT